MHAIAMAIFMAMGLLIGVVYYLQADVGGGGGGGEL